MRLLAGLAAIIFVGMGVGGYLLARGQAEEPLLFGLLMVGMLHSVVHLVTGLCATLSVRRRLWAQRYFRIVGVVYGVASIIGFVQHSTILGLMHVNAADNLLHLLTATVALTIGYGVRYSLRTSAVYYEGSV